MKNLFKYASLLFAAAMLSACGGDNKGPEGPNGGNTDGKLELTSDKNLIQTFGGDYATLSVTLDGKAVTEEVIFFDADKQIVDIPDFKFSTTKPGEHQLIASYGTYISEPLTIKAIGVEIPQTPNDPNPGSTDFKARVLVTEFTTTGCTYCPGMKRLIHGAMEDPSMADKLVFTACHSGLINNVKDPAYVRTGYEDFSQSTGFPYMFCDMYHGFGYYPTWSVNNMNDVLNQLYDNKEAAAGIAVNSSLVDGQLVAKVTIKAAKSANYRVGAFLLEDGIYGKQSNAGADEEWMHTHDGVIRYLDSQSYIGGKETYYGHSIGKVEAGSTADYVFVWDIDQIWKDGAKNGEIYGGYKWDAFVMEKLHLAVFTTTAGKDLNGREVYVVNNAVDCPVNGQTPFEYK